MNRTEFLKQALDYLHPEQDIDDMRYFFKDIYYFKPIVDGFNRDISNEVARDMEKFFKKIGINKTYNELEALEFCNGKLKQNYNGIGVIVDFYSLYDDLIQENLIKKPNEKIIMYRIENINGDGFYSHFREKGEDLANYIEMDSPNTPSPISDGLLHFIYHNDQQRDLRNSFLFGWKSKEQAAKWLLEEERILDYIILDEELVFSEYEIDPTYTIESNKQIVCLKEHCKLKNKLPLQEVLKGQKELLEFNKKIENDFLSLKDTKEIISFLKNKDGSLEIKKEKVRKNKKREQNNNERQMPLF